MTKSDELAALVERVAKAMRGWRNLGDRNSNGEVMCTGCWDRSDYDVDADHDIPPGNPVFYSNTHPEYGDCDAYCLRCVIEDARDWEVIGVGEADDVLEALKRMEQDNAD